MCLIMPHIQQHDENGSLGFLEGRGMRMLDVPGSVIWGIALWSHLRGGVPKGFGRITALISQIERRFSEQTLCRGPDGCPFPFHEPTMPIDRSWLTILACRHYHPYHHFSYNHHHYQQYITSTTIAAVPSTLRLRYLVLKHWTLLAYWENGRLEKWGMELYWH